MTTINASFRRKNWMPSRIINVGLIFALAVCGSEQDTRKTLSFETVSIKRMEGNGHVTAGVVGQTFRASGITTMSLLLQAYGVRVSDIVGAPGWVSTEHYDVIAKASENLNTFSQEERQQMWQEFLRDRLKLSVHREVKQEGTAYALVAGKKGPRLSPSSEQKTSIFKTWNTNGNQVTLKKASMTVLSRVLTGAVGHPVLDATGIEGDYDITLEWTPEARVMAGSPEVRHSPVIFTAIREQLGLQLVPRKTPLKILIIDHIEKPSEN